MKLLIEIDDHIYDHAKELSEDSQDEYAAMRAIANGTPLTIVFNKIIDEIEQESFHDANGVIYVPFNRVKKILKKYKGGSEDGK